MSVNFSKYQLILALDSIYYLNSYDREKFFLKLGNYLKEDFNNTLICSIPIIKKSKYSDSNYFSETLFNKNLNSHGIGVVKEINNQFYLKNKKNYILNFYYVLFKILLKFKFFYFLMNYLPKALIYSKIYILRHK